MRKYSYFFIGLLLCFNLLALAQDGLEVSDKYLPGEDPIDLNAEESLGDLSEDRDTSLRSNDNASDITDDTSENYVEATDERDDLEMLKQDIGAPVAEEESISFEKNTSDSKTTVQVLDNRHDLKSTDAEELIDVGAQDEFDILNSINKDGYTPLVSQRRSTRFDLGDIEKKLLEEAKFVQTKMPEREWKSIAGIHKTEKYTVVQGDMLWTIARRLFGSGFYYSKIWALNPYITNPHEISPGMILTFDTGDDEDLPRVTFDAFERQGETGLSFTTYETSGLNADSSSEGATSSLGDSVTGTDRAQTKTKDELVKEMTESGALPAWPIERQKLIEQGIYFESASEFTYEDLINMGGRMFEREYETYTPPINALDALDKAQEIPEDFDTSGFDRSARVSFNLKEGLFLSSFITDTPIVDLGMIKAKQDESLFLRQGDTIYVEFDTASMPRPGDLFSVYVKGGKVTHPISERTGIKYDIVAQIKVIAQKEDLFECYVFQQAGLSQRGDRITVYTPKIDRIVKRYSKRSIEAAIIGSYNAVIDSVSFGEIVYIDRGRADGLLFGDVLDAWSFYDRGTNIRITKNPTYKIGEVTIVTTTENFSTGLVTKSSSPIPLGTILLTKSLEDLQNEFRTRRGTHEAIGDENAGNQLDIQMQVDDVSNDLLNKASEITLTEEELEELERQERERSIISGRESDLRDLENLEAEMIKAQEELDAPKRDLDKELEDTGLDNIEQGADLDPDAFESLDLIEDEFGKKYMDEDINAKENPYGLTEFDLEDIDDLLNLDTESNDVSKPVETLDAGPAVPSTAPLGP